MEGYKEGWKVVQIDSHGRMVSCFAPGHAVKDYIYDLPSLRTIGNGPLAVFDSRDAAMSFIINHTGDGCGLKLARCLYKPSKLKTREYWYRDEYSKNRYRRTIVPKGSDFADEVILKKEE